MRFFSLILIFLVSLFQTAPVNALEKIRLMSEEMPPFSYTENGIVKGENVDKVLSLMTKAGYDVQADSIEMMPWIRAYKTLENTPHTALFSMARTPQRETLFKWVGPLSSLKMVIIAKKTSSITINSLADLTSHTLGAVRGSAPEQFLKKKRGIDPATLKRIAKPLQSIKQLESGRIDIFAFSLPTFRYLCKQNNINFNEYEVVYTLKEVNLYLAFNKNTSDDLITSLQTLLLPPTTKVERPIIISGHPNYPPFTWYDGTKMRGVGVKLTNYLCKELGIDSKVEYRGPWKKVQDDAKKGLIDLINVTYRTKTRDTYLTYTMPFIASPTCVTTRAQKNTFIYEDLDSLKGKTGSTLYGDSLGQMLDDYAAKHLKLERALTPDALIKNLLNFRADYILWGRYPTLINATKMNCLKDIRISSITIAEEPMYLGFSKNSPFAQYTTHCNAIIARLKADGTMQKWLQESLDEYGVSIKRYKKQ